MFEVKIWLVEELLESDGYSDVQARMVPQVAAMKEWFFTQIDSHPTAPVEMVKRLVSFFWFVRGD